MSRSHLELHINVLKESIKTLTYQIDNLKKFYSKEQVWCWKMQRYKLRKKLKFNEEMLKARKRDNAKRAEDRRQQDFRKGVTSRIKSSDNPDK